MKIRSYKDNSRCIASLQVDRTGHGFTLIELLISLAIGAIVLSLAVPAYTRFIEKSEVAIAIADIQNISTKLERYQLIHYELPDSLADAGLNLKDPWGNPYRYLNMSTAKGNGKKRKDKNLVPINSDYDLYSMGPDGKSVAPLTAKHSRDDIIRAGDGTYVGAAEDY